MLKIILLVAFSSLIIVSSNYLLKNDGLVIIIWNDYQIDSSFFFFLICLLLLIFLIFFVFIIVTKIINLPSFISKKFHDKKLGKENNKVIISLLNLINDNYNFYDFENNIDKNDKTILNLIKIYILSKKYIKLGKNNSAINYLEVLIENELFLYLIFEDYLKILLINGDFVKLANILKRVDRRKIKLTGLVKFEVDKSNESVDLLIKLIEMRLVNVDCYLSLAKIYLDKLEYSKAQNILSDAWDLFYQEKIINFCIMHNVLVKPHLLKTYSDLERILSIVKFIKEDNFKEAEVLFAKLRNKENDYSKKILLIISLKKDSSMDCLGLENE